MTGNRKAGSGRNAPDPGAIPEVGGGRPHPVYGAKSGHARVRRESTGSPATWLLSASGEFDVDTIDCLRDALTAARKAHAERILLDLADVVFGDSTFLHELVRAHRGPSRLVLVGPLPGQLRRLFEMTGTYRLFHITLDGDGTPAPAPDAEPPTAVPPDASAVDPA
ncbi:STAS domain-containing protein [Streptomyces sp. TLI_105]|uniref:STAS domain-containing protein n=1 Tax=Streptomyces sp. TLI_105 TaxID=1881019 RepID=UPI0008978BB0|nr:STAS domain-containing protein [Streptomyces sp. TLI_105]SEB66585.1 anti-anti-sigma factor [Streptomyces sp. TLI_105]